MEELIVNGENVLHPADFRRDKDELARIRGGIPSDSNLPYFKEKNWIFNANVKGEDINGFVSSLQSKLATIQNTELGLTNVIDACITAFESLDKNYLQGICIAVNAGQEADKQANDALEKIKATLEVLSQFKDELKQNTKHLNDIDTMWDDIHDVLAKCISIENELKKESELVKSTSTELLKFQEEFNKVEHLTDIDEMYTNISSLEGRENFVSADLIEIHSSVGSLSEFATTINENLNNKEADISALKEHVSGLDKLIKINSEGAMNEIDEFKTKLKRIYLLFGGVASIVVVQFILNIMGVL